MSRIGKLPIAIPRGVDVKIDESNMTIKGPKGELSHQNPGLIHAEIENDRIVVSRQNESKQCRALHGLNRSLIANKVEGVTNGFVKKLEIVGVGYRAEVQGKNLTLAVGFSHPIIFQAPSEVDLSVEDGNRITVSGIDKQLINNWSVRLQPSYDRLRNPSPIRVRGSNMKVNLCGAKPVRPALNRR